MQEGLVLLELLKLVELVGEVVTLGLGGQSVRLRRAMFCLTASSQKEAIIRHGCPPLADSVALATWCSLIGDVTEMLTGFERFLVKLGGLSEQFDKAKKSPEPMKHEILRKSSLAISNSSKVHA